MNEEQMRAEFEDWWEQFKSEHEEWQWADREALLFQAWQAALSAMSAPAKDDYYGTYDSEDFGFNLRDFYCNEKELIDKGLILPLYIHPHPPNEAVQRLKALVTALDSAFISTWQSTAYWQKELDEARAYLVQKGEQEDYEQA